MNRRTFLSALAATFVADPEKALWVPGKKLISVPKPRVSPAWAVLHSFNPILLPGDHFTLQDVRGVFLFEQIFEGLPIIRRVG
jgi:hypothetical protein